MQLAEGDPDRLSCVADLLTASLAADSLPPADQARRSAIRHLIEQAMTQAFDRLRWRCEQSDAPAQAHASLARLYHQRGDLDLAIRHYRRAVRLDYDQIGWRYALAQLLAQTNSSQEAMHEARICLRFNGDYAPAKELLGRLSADATVGVPSSPIR
jgi:tetratricopeptide (TPR) repeat protein